MHSLVQAAYIVTALLGVIVTVWLARRHALPGWGVALIALGVIVFVVTSFKLSSPPEAFWDFFRAYYPAGRAALDHDTAALEALIRIGAAGGFVNLPAVAYLFAPFGWLPPHLAAVFYTVIGIGLTVAAWFLLVRLARLERREQWLLAVLFLANGPLMSAIKWGNISYFLIFVLAAGLALLRAERSLAAGMLLAVAAILKPAFALFGIFFLLRRDPRGVLGFALVGAATVSLSLVLFGWKDNLFWLQTSILHYSDNWLAVSGNQSIPAFLLRLHEPPAILLDFSAKAPGKGEKLLAELITALIFLTAVVACVRPRSPATADAPAQAGERRDLQYLLTICLCLVCSPLSWTHYYAWLLIPTAFFLGARSPVATSKPARWIGWTAIALVTPIVLWPQSTTHSALNTLYTSFLVSHHLFGGLLWFGLIAWWLAGTGGLMGRARPMRASRRLIRPAAGRHPAAQDR